MRRNSNTNSEHDPSLLAIIDIETIVPVEHADPTGGFVKWVHHRPVVASVLTSEAMGKGQYEFDLTSVFCEPGAEQDFYAEIDRHIPKAATLCGWNTTGFDLPTLAINAIASRSFGAANLSSFHRAHRFGSEHADLADLYGSRGSAPKPSLLEVCGRLGIPVKMNSHGVRPHALRPEASETRRIHYRRADSGGARSHPLNRRVTRHGNSPP